MPLWSWLSQTPRLFRAWRLTVHQGDLPWLGSPND